MSIVEIKEVLRLWVRGYGQREIARLAQLDRKTVACYVDAAEAAGSPMPGVRRPSPTSIPRQVFWILSP